MQKAQSFSQPRDIESKLKYSNQSIPLNEENQLKNDKRKKSSFEINKNDEKENIDNKNEITKKIISYKIKDQNNESDSISKNSNNQNKISNIKIINRSNIKPEINNLNKSENKIEKKNIKYENIENNEKTNRTNNIT